MVERKYQVVAACDCLTCRSSGDPIKRVFSGVGAKDCFDQAKAAGWQFARQRTLAFAPAHVVSIPD